MPIYISDEEYELAADFGSIATYSMPVFVDSAGTGTRH